MKKASRTFQIFAKPAGYSCNLSCDYCYYLSKDRYFTETSNPRMSQELVERYIRQHIQASSDPIITFSWHGGEPTLLGLDFFRKVVAYQNNYCPAGQKIANAIQTNGTLLTEEWSEFLAAEGFVVGLSLDGPRELHDQFRRTKGGQPSFDKVMSAYRLLRDHQVYCDILCVVNAHNVEYPLELYRFFKEIGAPYLTLLPLVEFASNEKSTVSSRSVPALALGNFLCTIFDEWKAHDIETIKINLFEEAARTAFGQEQTLCIFRKTCGDIPVVEYNGDVFCCDHYVNDQYKVGNIWQTPLVNLLESNMQKGFGASKQTSLPACCHQCDVLNLCHGGCPKDRQLITADEQPGLNFLCQGYQQFFRHFRPFADQLTALWQQQNMENQATISKSDGVGRNDPCPCGSGKKYKKCCLLG